jgi:hypothetical protein
LKWSRRKAAISGLGISKSLTPRHLAATLCGNF